jgi:hypothetical protein
VYELWREPIKSEALANARFGAHNQTRPHLYSITSSARVSTADGMVRPSAFVDRSLGRLAHGATGSLLRHKGTAWSPSLTNNRILTPFQQISS